MQSNTQLLGVLHAAIAGTIGDGIEQMTLADLAILLLVYSTQPPHTVRGLAAQLALDKGVVSKRLIRLEQWRFVERLDDPADRRSIWIGCTAQGDRFMRDLRDLLEQTAG